jgi:hypothetical protein
VTITEDGTDNFGTWWDGGSRRVLSYVDVKTGKVAGHPPTAGPFGGGEVRGIPMKEGCAILDCGTFCGKNATPHWYVHPDDVGDVIGQELVVADPPNGWDKV